MLACAEVFGVCLVLTSVRNQAGGAFSSSTLEEGSSAASLVIAGGAITRTSSAGWFARA